MKNQQTQKELGTKDSKVQVDTIHSNLQVTQMDI
jgi:hypothetical protein